MANMVAAAVPKKMIPMSKVMGVESFKEIKPEMVALKPIGHANTVYKTKGVNKISFRIPSYSNALLDTARSFISVVAAGCTEPSPTPSEYAVSGSKGIALTAGAPIFRRLVIKSSAGLTLEDIDQLDVLDQLFELHEDTSNASHSLLYGKSLGPQFRPEQKHNGRSSMGNGRVMTKNESIVRNFQCANAGNTPETLTSPMTRDNIFTPAAAGNIPIGLDTRPVGIELMYRFNVGILSKRLAKYLPLFMADGGAGYTFDLDIYVNDSRALTNVGVTDVPAPELWVHSPVYNMCLLRMDEGLSRKFNSMALSGAEVRIPFTTFHTHLASVDAKQINIMIHENATNFKRIWTLLTTLDENGAYYFRGGIRDPDMRLFYYNYRLGTTFVYNEPVQEEYSNFRTVQHVKNALGVGDNYTLLSEMPMGQLMDSTDAYSAVPAGILHEFNAFHTVANFDYSPEERLMIQGVSSSNPVELHLKIATKAQNTGALPSGLMAVNFAELCYDLVFRSGIVTYEEQKPGSQSVY